MSPRAIAFALALGAAVAPSCARPPSRPSQAPAGGSADAPNAALDLTPLAQEDVEHTEEHGQAWLEATWPSLRGGSDPTATAALDRALAERAGLARWKDALGDTISLESTTRIECRSDLATQHLVSMSCERTVDGYDDDGHATTSTTRWGHTLVFRDGRVHELRWREQLSDPKLAAVIARRIVERDTLLAAAGLDEPRFVEVEAKLSDYVDHCGLELQDPAMVLDGSEVVLWPGQAAGPCVSRASTTLAELAPALAPGSPLALLAAHVQRSTPAAWREDEEDARLSPLPLFPLDTPLADPPALAPPSEPTPDDMPCNEGTFERIERPRALPPAWRYDGTCDDGSAHRAVVVELDGRHDLLLETFQGTLEVHPGLGGELVLEEDDCCCQHTLRIHGLRGGELEPVAEASGCYDSDACTMVVEPRLVVEHGRLVAIERPRDCDDPHGPTERISLDLRHDLGS